MTQPITLWVAPVSNLAGVARHIIDVARVGLPDYQLVVAAPEGPLLDELRALNCPVRVLDLDQKVPAVVAQLRHYVMELNPSIVHSHLAKADFLCAMATVGLPTKLVSSEHHIPEDPLIFHGNKAKAYTRQAAHHARIRRFDQLIAVSESTKRDMLKYWRPSVPVTVVLNGVDRVETEPERSPGLRLLSLTRLSQEKNLDMTLRIFAKVRETHPEATLTIGGTGEEESNLKALAQELGLGDSASFVGFVDPIEAMQNHDVLLQPSKADNLSYTLLDAVNYGMGVVASNIGGNGEIVAQQCLVSLNDIEGGARLVVEQGLDLTRRPVLPEVIPTVSQMARQIVDVYRKIGIPAAYKPTLSTPQQETSSPDISVVIAYYKNAATLPAQLDALCHQTDAPTFEVVIADNEGSLELRDIVENYRDRLDVWVVDATDKQGQCHARNTAVGHARAKIVALCDADDLVAPTWLHGAFETVSQSDVLATGPLRLDAINPEYVWRTYLGVGPDAPVTQPVLQDMITALGYERYAVGCNIAIRRESYLRLGGMNENLLGGSEDVDLSWRAIEAGVDLAYCNDMIVDYRLRTRVKDVFRQRRNYQRSQLNLWNISRQQGRPVQGMSLRWAVTESIKLGPAWYEARQSTTQEKYTLAAHSGSVLGNLYGQLYERCLHR